MKSARFSRGLLGDFFGYFLEILSFPPGRFHGIMLVITPCQRAEPGVAGPGAQEGKVEAIRSARPGHDPAIAEFELLVGGEGEAALRRQRNLVREAALLETRNRTQRSSLTARVFGWLRWDRLRPAVAPTARPAPAANEVPSASETA